MPTIITHSVFAISLAHVFKHSLLPRRFWLLAIVCTILPDIDVIGFSFGIQYGDFWGHRGFTHSLSFALLVSLLVVGLGFYQEHFRSLRPRLLLFFFIVTASHGVFDALTNGGLGIAFFSPFDTTRYFLPYRPIQVSPIGIHDFLKSGGWRVLESEFIWIAVPSVLLLFLSISIRLLLQIKAREPL
jgi:inner membrane protein